MQKHGKKKNTENNNEYKWPSTGINHESTYQTIYNKKKIEYP